jgi:kelch-like protein 10
MALLDEIVYATDGYDGHRDLNTAERYDYQTSQWSMIAPTNEELFEASAAALNSKVYNTGGFDGEVQLNLAEVYDPEFNQ